MLLLLHAIIPCLHTRIVIHLCGSVNSELQTIMLRCHELYKVGVAQLHTWPR